ncbi:hypothetical protein FRB94_009235 [Tulasnella sp. JGI-2019a]|nr:hypothetical protein FRB94_009235 [Tulasnella sp. JGI-2019a]KAG9016492.1 hypothetical protein FRB93_010741 [Tulasnella sp. JGI-2019a]
MLNLFLCSSRSAMEDDEGDFTLNTPVGGSPPRKKNSMGKGKKNVIKGLQIGSPTDFKHENHMGYDEIANMDVARYQEEMRIRIAEMTQAGTIISASFPKGSQATPSNLPRESDNAFVNPSDRRSSTPSSISSVGSDLRPRAVKRKAVPSMLLDGSDTAYTAIPPSQPSPPMRERQGSEKDVQRVLMPALGEKHKSGRKPVAPYEVPTTTARS